MANSTVLCIYNGHLVDKEIDGKGLIVALEGKIAAVVLGDFDSRQAMEMAKAVTGVAESEVELFDANGYIVQPSFIDMHVHLRYPGQTQKEDLSTGLKAAAAGGFGTLVLMPNTTPVISSVSEAVRINKEAAAYNFADVFQSVSLTQGFDGNNTSHLDEIAPYAAGVSAQDGAVPLATEDGRDVESSAVMLEAMTKCAERNIIVSCHSEDVTLAATAKPLRLQALELLRQSEENQTSASSCKAKAYELLEEANRLLTLAEDTATLRNIELAAAAGCAVHIAHVSTKDSVKAVRQAKAAGQRVTCEVTPHHLALSVENGDPALRHLVNPPLRSESDRQALLQALCDGTADVIATDHAPHTAEDKATGAPGFTGLETAYAVCNTMLVQSGAMTASRLSALMSSNPARILGLDQGQNPKGRLLPGYVADLVVCAPDAEWVVQAEKFYSKGKYTPLEGKTLQGKVVKVFRQGKSIFVSD